MTRAREIFSAALNGTAFGGLCAAFYEGTQADIAGVIIYLLSAIFFMLASIRQKIGS